MRELCGLTFNRSEAHRERLQQKKTTHANAAVGNSLREKCVCG